MEKILTKDATVACDGGEYNGHPRVYLDVAKSGSVICPYCSCEFVQSAKATDDA